MNTTPNPTQTREFHLSDILSLTTGVLLSTRHINGVYDILNFMTGDILYTHQLGRAVDECRPHLLAQHPKLAIITAALFTPHNYQAVLKGLLPQFGERLQVAALPKHAHEFIDPLSELAERVHPDKIIAIDPKP